MLLKFFNAKKDKHYFTYDKRNYDSFLDDPLCQAWKNINRFLLILVALSILSLSLETVRDNFIRFYDGFFVVNFLISSIFAFDYFYRFFKSRKKLTFPISFFNIIDLLSFFPFFLQLIFTNAFWINVLNVFRILRIFRLFDFVKHTPVIIRFAKSIKSYEKEYKVAFTLMWIVLIFISVIVYYFENPINPQFSSIPNAFWWGIVTMATVWYWDITPITPFWKIFGSLIIILGPLLIAVVSSITILIFMDLIEVQKKVKYILELWMNCTRCYSQIPNKSNYCNNCWENLNEEKKENVKENEKNVKKKTKKEVKE